MLKQSISSRSLIIVCIISYLYAPEKFSRKISAKYTTIYTHHFVLNLILSSSNFVVCFIYFLFFHKFGIHFSTKVIGESSFGRGNVFTQISWRWMRTNVLIAYLYLTRMKHVCNFIYKELALLTRLVEKGLWEEDCEQETEGLVGKMWYSKMQKVGGKRKWKNKKEGSERAIEERSGAQKGIRADRWTGVGRNSPAAAGTAVIILTGVN